MQKMTVAVKNSKFVQGRFRFQVDVGLSSRDIRNWVVLVDRNSREPDTQGTLRTRLQDLFVQT